MKEIFIFGTGAHASKVYHCAVGCGYKVSAFVDENPAAVAPISGQNVIEFGSLPKSGDVNCIFVAIGRADVRRRLLEQLAQMGWNLPPLVHTSAWVSPDAQLGPGVLVAAGAVIETATVIGRGAIVDIGVLIDHECDVGEFCHLRPGEVFGPRTFVPSAA